MPRNRGTTKAKKCGLGQGRSGENHPTAAQHRAQERNAKRANHAAEAVYSAATPPSTADRKAETSNFKVLYDHSPRIAITECYRNQFDLEPAALWHPIDGYDGTISGIMKAMPQILDGLWGVVRRVMVDVQE